MFWPGFGVLCVLGARLITLGAASLSSAGNGTTISFSGMDRGSMGGGDGQGPRYGTEVEELVRTGRVEVDEVVTTKGDEGWGIPTLTSMVEGQVIMGAAEVWIMTTVNSVSICVPVRTSSEGGRTSDDSLSSTLLSSSRSGSKICGWMEATSIVEVERSVSATRTVEFGKALSQSTMDGSKRRTGDAGPYWTLPNTSVRQSSTAELAEEKTFTSTTRKAATTSIHSRMTTKSTEGTSSTPFTTPATAARSTASTDRVLAAATVSAAGSMSGKEEQANKNSAVLLDVEESNSEENGDGRKNEKVAVDENGVNGTMTFVDDKASVRSNGTMTDDLALEAVETSASAGRSSTSTIFDTKVMETGNSKSGGTSSERSRNEQENPARKTGTGNENANSGATNTTSLQPFSTIFECSTLSSSKTTSPYSGIEDSKAGPSNLKDAIVLLTVVSNHTSFDVMEVVQSQNVTADSPSMMLNATLPETTELSPQNAGNLNSSVLSSAHEPVTRNDETRNTTSMDSAPLANNKSTSTILTGILSASTSSAILPGFNNGAALSTGLGNSSNFLSANHSADILGILAGNTSPTINNAGAGALVVFALPFDQSMAEEVANGNSSSADTGNATNTDMGIGTTLPDPATSRNITIVGDPSIPLNDTKLKEYDTLYKVHETGTKMATDDGILGDGNMTGFENVLLPLNDSTLNQLDNLSIMNDTGFISPIASNKTTMVVVENWTAQLGDVNLNISSASYGLNESAVVVVATILHQQELGNGTGAKITLGAPGASIANGTMAASSGDVANMTAALAEWTTTQATNGTAPSYDASSISVSLDLNQESFDGMIKNVTVSSPNATSLPATEIGMAGDLTTMSNGTAPNKANTVFLNAISSTNLSDAQVRRYISRLGDALHMSQDNLKDVVCTDESLMNDKVTLSRDEFGLVEQACLELWEKQALDLTNETAPLSAVEAMANVTETIILESLPSNMTASIELQDHHSTESDGNAPERLGPTKTTLTTITTRSISITPSSSMQSVTTTTTGTSFLTTSTLSTSFTSSSSYTNSKTTSTSSSMRPKMTACVDDFDFFDMTDANLEESGTIAWYMNWTAISAAQEGKFNSLGEVRYFGQQWLKDPDYDCGLEYGGCTRRPSCNSILSLYPNDEELARRIYFVMKMHSTINTVMKSYYDAIQLTHQNVAAQIHTIISTTMQTPHFDDVAACKFLQTSYSNIQTIIIDLYEPRTTMEGKGWNDPWFVDELKYTSPSAQGIWWLQYPDPITHKEKGMTRWVHGRLMMLYKMWFKDSIGRMDASMKLCDGLGIVNQDKAGTEEKLKLALSKFSTYQRRELSKHVRELNKGKFYGEGDPSVLSSMLTMGIWNNEEAPQSALNILSDPYQLEEMMTNQSKEGILSQSYIQQKCYMKCVTHPHAQLLCEGFNDWEFSTKHALKHGGTPADEKYYEQTGPMSGLSEAEKNMRICPEPNKVCQVECWSQEKKGWSMPLHGVNQLGNEPLGVDIQEKMKEIYAYYKENGNASPYGKPQDPTKDMEANLSDLPKPGPPPKGPRFWLPVCDSDQGYTHIVDFGQQRHSKYNLKQHSRGLDQRSFPVSCGSFRSDQTVEFMEAMGLTNHHSRDVSWTMDPFFQNYAPLNLAVLIEAPLDNFLAFCALGIAYPQNDLMDSKHGEMGISRKGSRWCEPIAQETEGMGWYMANLWFCRKSPSARQLFKIQGMSGAIVGLHKIKNHQQLCRRWLATAQGEQMGGLDEIDGSQSKNRKVGAEAIGFPNKIDAYGDKSGKGGRHAHAPVTEDGRSKGWFEVMHRKKGNGKRDVGNGDRKEERESFRAVMQAEEAAKRKEKEVVEDMGVSIDLEEARREEEAYWKEFAAIKDEEGDDELDGEHLLG